MNGSLLKYFNALLASFEARDKGDIGLEDDLLADLDQLWLAMSGVEKEQSAVIAHSALGLHKTMVARRPMENLAHAIVELNVFSTEAVNSYGSWRTGKSNRGGMGVIDSICALEDDVRPATSGYRDRGYSHGALALQ